MTSSTRWPRPPNVCHQLHMPLQSGSDRMLRAMRRSYRSERYLKILSEVRAAMPDAAITTDIIVGFPGETEDDFQATLDVVVGVPVRRGLHLPVLAAAGHAGRDACPIRCPREVVTERFQRLAAVVERVRAGRQPGADRHARSRCWSPPARGARTRAAAGSPAGPGTAGWCTSCRAAPSTGRSGPATWSPPTVTYAAPHHLVADSRRADPPPDPRR